MLFWKKKPASENDVKIAKVKKLSPKEELENIIMALHGSEVVNYRLSETFGGGLAVVGINPKYPEKSKKQFTLYTETIIDGKPSGKRQFLWDYNKASDMARWILDRNGKPFDAS